MPFKEGDAVLVGPKKVQGVVRFVGETSFLGGEWVGVELSEAIGKTDGAVAGVRYFTCPPRHGLFVRASALSSASLASPPAPGAGGRAQPLVSDDADSAKRGPATNGGAQPHASQRMSFCGEEGTVRFCGPTKFAEGTWIGVELDEARGGGDGSVMGLRYFHCAPGHAFFCQLPTVGSAPGHLVAAGVGSLRGAEAAERPVAAGGRPPSERAGQRKRDSTAHAAGEHHAHPSDGAPKDPNDLARADQDVEECLREARAPASAGSAEHALQRSQAPGWTFREWLRSLPFNAKLADCLQKQLGARDHCGLMLRLLKALAARRDDGCRAAVQRLLARSGALEVLTEALAAGARELSQATAVDAAELHSKFVQAGDAFTMSYGQLSVFFGGLEALIGSSDANFLAAMRREHCEAADSAAPFTTGNYGIRTTSRAEWFFVASPERGPGQAGLGEWPREAKADPERNRRPLPLAAFAGALARCNEQLRAEQQPELTEPELVGLRLYTGPMFEKYNAVLRGGAIDEEHRRGQPQFMQDRFMQLCGGNRYTTTCHVINSAMVKLGKIMKAQTVYRGISGGVLPDTFWEANRWNVCGGVEYGFMSTTTNRAVAMDYASNGGRAGTVFEIRMGMVDRGADLSWISQYPDEREVCFAPLTGLEVLNQRVDKAVLVVEVRLSVNLVALTIEQVVAKRHKMLTEMCRDFLLEVQCGLEGPHWQWVRNECGANWATVRGRLVRAAQARLAEVTALDPAAMNDNAQLVDAVGRAIHTKGVFERPTHETLGVAREALEPVCSASASKLTELMKWSDPKSLVSAAADLLRSVQDDNVHEVTQRLAAMVQAGASFSLVLPPFLGREYSEQEVLEMAGQFREFVEGDAYAFMDRAVHLLSDLAPEGVEVAAEKLSLLLAARPEINWLHFEKQFTVGENMACAVARVVETSVTLDRLVMIGCGIGPIGGHALARALGSNRSLRSVDLSFNGGLNYQERGKPVCLRLATVLADMLRNSAEGPLRELRLQWCGFQADELTELRKLVLGRPNGQFSPQPGGQ